MVGLSDCDVPLSHDVSVLFFCFFLRHCQQGETRGALFTFKNSLKHLAKNQTKLNHVVSRFFVLTELFFFIFLKTGLNVQMFHICKMYRTFEGYTVQNEYPAS